MLKVEILGLLKCRAPCSPFLRLFVVIENESNQPIAEVSSLDC